MKLSALDAAIICTYFAMVLAVGYYLKGKIKTSSDFLLTDRSLTHWITGIAFMSANLGSLEIMGHIANGAKYGMRTMNQSLLEMFKGHLITWDVALTRSSDPEDLRRMAQRDGLTVA